MIQNQSRDGEIDKMARKIYRHVCANRNRQAYDELLGLGPETLPVAQAMVLGSFRTTPAVRCGRALLGAALVSAPMLVALTVSRAFGHSPQFALPGEDLMFSFGVPGAAIVAEVLIIGMWLDLSRRRIAARRENYPCYRANEIAGMAIANAVGDSSQLLHAVMAAGMVDPAPSASTGARLDTALIRLLKLSETADLARLTRTEKNWLWLRLSRAAGELRRARRYTEEHVSEFASDCQSAVLGIEILRLYERVVDASALTTVRSIAAESPVGLPVCCAALIGQAQQCLPALEALAIQTRSSAELLRGCNAVSQTADQLVRAYVFQDGGDGQDLLRSSNAGSPPL